MIRKNEATSDEQIQHLQHMVNQLKRGLNRVDQDVDNAARRYLKSTVPSGHLHFSDFLDLLVREIRREVRLEMKADEKLIQAAKKASTGLIAEKVEEIAASKLPALLYDVSKYVMVRALIVRYKTVVPGTAPSSFYYHSLAVRGNVKHGYGLTEEEAWTSLKERISLKLAAENRKDVLEFLSSEHPLIEERFRSSPLWREDSIGEFKVQIRLEDKT